MSKPDQNIFMPEPTVSAPKNYSSKKIIVGFKIDENLYYEFKIKIIKERKTGSQVIEELMRKYVMGEVNV